MRCIGAERAPPLAWRPSRIAVVRLCLAGMIRLGVADLVHRPALVRSRRGLRAVLILRSLARHLFFVDLVRVLRFARRIRIVDFVRRRLLDRDLLRRLDGDDLERLFFRDLGVLLLLFLGRLRLLFVLLFLLLGRLRIGLFLRDFRLLRRRCVGGLRLVFVEGVVVGRLRIVLGVGRVRGRRRIDRRIELELHLRRPRHVPLRVIDGFANVLMVGGDLLLDLFHLLDAATHEEVYDQRGAHPEQQRDVDITRLHVPLTVPPDHHTSNATGHGFLCDSHGKPCEKNFTSRCVKTERARVGAAFRARQRPRRPDEPGAALIIVSKCVAISSGVHAPPPSLKRPVV